MLDDAQPKGHPLGDIGSGMKYPLKVGISNASEG
jgi:hypothetical protein